MKTTHTIYVALASLFLTAGISVANPVGSAKTTLKKTLLKEQKKEELRNASAAPEKIKEWEDAHLKIENLLKSV